MACGWPPPGPHVATVMALLAALLMVPLPARAASTGASSREVVHERTSDRPEAAAALAVAFAEGDEAGETVFYSSQCRGQWSAWSRCDKDCWRSRRFSLKVKEACPTFAMGDNEYEYEICHTDKCEFNLHEAGSFQELKDSLFRLKLNTGKLKALGICLGKFQVGLQTAIITVIIGLALVQHLQLEWLPDIGVAIPFAACFALGFRLMFHGVSFGPALNEGFGTAVSRIMQDFLIPISIFEGAYHCQQLNFYSQFCTGVFFAVVGTLLSCIMIAAMVKYTGELGMHEIRSWRESFAYGAFIADVDPVATLSIFSQLRVDALLAAVVAGEATLNDPIALVIFGICNQHEKQIDLSFGDEGVKTAILLGGSILLGLVMGLLLTKCIGVLKIRGKGWLETIYVCQCAFVSYSIGEYVGMSGIIVTLFSGLMMGVYAEHMVEDHASVKVFIYNMARMADLLMFIIIGLSLVLVDDYDGLGLGLLTIVFCFISRAIMITLLVPVVNIVKRAARLQTISVPTAFMMFHSGLRGGMTVMMALMLDPYWIGPEHANKLTIATITTVIGMVYLCGCTGPFFLRRVGVPMNCTQEDGTLVSRRTFINQTNRVVEMIITGTRTEMPHRVTRAPSVEAVHRAESSPATL